MESITPMGLFTKRPRPNGKAYIGQTIRSLAQRKAAHYTSDHCPAFFAALQKYGRDVRWETIAECKTQAELNAAETAAIAKFNTLSPNGYNIKEGGAKGRHSAETRAQNVESPIRRPRKPRGAKREKPPRKIKPIPKTRIIGKHWGDMSPEERFADRSRWHREKFNRPEVRGEI